MHKIIKYNNKLKVLGWHLYYIWPTVVRQLWNVRRSAHSLKTGQERSFIGNEYSGICYSLGLSLVADCFYSQKKRIIRRIISLPLQRYNRLIKILDKPPSGGRVVTTLFQQLKYIPSIQTDLDDLWKLRFSLQHTKHIDVLEN